jgi:hypothetical protein
MIKKLFPFTKEMFQNVFLYSTLGIVSFFIITEFFNFIFKVLGTNISEKINAQTFAGIETQIAPGTEATLPLLGLLIFVVMLFFVLLLFNFSFFENLTWNIIFKKKTNIRNTLKFSVLVLLLGLILSALNLILFMSVSKIPESMLTIFSTILLLLILFSLYLMYVGFISFANNQKILPAVKNTFTIGFGKLNKTWKALLVAVVILLLLNIVTWIFSWTPELIQLIVQALVFALYVSWFKLYLVHALRSVSFEK